ncbi:hypothetical protein J2Y48_003145 [Mycoplana sp. BE70]|uniref:GSCFA domain-containing protein n=1 Tax=Mycoplana sp. BE70 TaxID=2817775 RepID=UPI002857697D|nr:GSCFA domain-containing protein [Mycoplana sp. BE70]MDR6757848.1 hypothetical protein [Mycoplana sp. BE70]
MSVQQIKHDPTGLGMVDFEDGGKAQRVTYTWYRGEDCNFGPTLSHLEDWNGYSDYFVGSFAPHEPVITAKSRVTAFGSCFAANISKWLAKRHYNVLNAAEKDSPAYVVRMGEGMVTSYAIRQQIEWAFENKPPQIPVWHSYSAESMEYDESIRQETLRIFSETDVFVLTFGLSEVWHDKPTGEVFWRAVPQDQFDPARHGFRTVSIDENYENLRVILQTIRRHRPEAKVIVTLSPIPLVATFRPVPSTSANSISKASLRMAIDKVMTAKEFEGMTFYWPSYEIVIEGFLAKWRPDRRHVKSEILDFIMTLFEKRWCVGDISEKELASALLAAKVADGSLKQSTLDMLLKGPSQEASKWIGKMEAKERFRLISSAKAVMSA